MATATSLSNELLSLKEDMGWSWSEMANQVEGALNVKGPSGSTLFRYAKGQANPSDLVEQTVLKAIQTIREKQLAEAEATSIEVEDEIENAEETSNVSNRSITEISKAEVAEDVEEHAFAEVEGVATSDDEAVGTSEIVYNIPEITWPEAIDPETPFAAGLALGRDEHVEEASIAYPEFEGPTAHGVGIVIDEVEQFVWPIEAISWSELEADVPFAYGLSLNPITETEIETDEIVDEEALKWPIEPANWAELDGVESFAHGLSLNAVTAEQIVDEEIVEENEMLDEALDGQIDPSLDIDEAGLLEHYEIDAIMDAQAAMARDLDDLTLIISEIDVNVDINITESAETTEAVEEVVEMAETAEVEEAAVSEENEEVIETPQIDSRELLESLYEHPATFASMASPAQYFIFDEAVDADRIPTLADLGASSLMEPVVEPEELLVGQSEIVGDIVEEAGVDVDIEEIRILSPFGEGSLYANGSSIEEYGSCPKACEFSARSREIMYSPPEGD